MRRESVLLGGALLLALLGVVAYRQTREEPPPNEAPPFFYEIDPVDVARIEVRHADLAEAFAWDEEGGYWRFDDPGGERVDEERFGGMPVLVAGPRIERTLPEGLDLAALGLTPPRATVTVGLDSGAEFVVLIGRATPDESAHYVKQANDASVFLVNAVWGDVLTRLATEPPRLPAEAP